jgi:hypothetical protein
MGTDGDSRELYQRAGTEKSNILQPLMRIEETVPAVQLGLVQPVQIRPKLLRPRDFWILRDGTGTASRDY